MRAVVSYKNLSQSAKSQVDAIAPMLMTMEPTPFSGEAIAVFNLRSKRCLEGWRYDLADLEARAIVIAALSRIGAKRPDWRDGQPIAQADALLTCAACGAPLYGPEDHFCSDVCRYRTNNTRVSARKAAEREGMTCAWCAGPIKGAQRRSQKYCSIECQTSATWQQRPKTECTCLWCGSIFHRYSPPSAPARFCSLTCGNRWRWANRGMGPRKLRAASAECTENPGSSVGE